MMNMNGWPAQPPEEGLGTKKVGEKGGAAEAKKRLHALWWMRGREMMRAAVDGGQGALVCSSSHG